ncbi:MAG: hypothetical protein J5842_05505, partial [Lachnospiraceae bacterium]|nr:hypothetical protein [Lachnospiraceae bacterium]
MPGPKIQKNTWEFLPQGTMIPPAIRNSFDPNVIAQYLNDNKSKLSQTEQQYLAHKQISVRKLRDKVSQVSGQVNNGTYQEKKTKLTRIDDTATYTLDELKLPAYQTSDFGCWSCFFLLALQSRGINDLTQEDIRAFRPVKEDQEPFDQISDEDMNKDIKNNMLDMADLALDLLPDTMVKSTEIYSYHKLNSNAYGQEQNDPAKKTAYFNAIVKSVKQQIIRSIRDHQSPIGLMMDGHYITITGIEGDIVSYKNSMPNEVAGNNPDHTHKKKLSELLDKALNGENADAITLTWLEDIKLSKKDNIIYNTTNPNTIMLEDGTVVNEALEDQTVFYDERHAKGMLIGCTGGIDLPERDSNYRIHDKFGFFKIDKTYIPKNLNVGSLQKKASERSDEEESALENERKKTIDTQAAYQKEIDEIKKAAPVDDDIAPLAVDPRAGRFKITILYSGRPFYGANTFYDFKNLMSGLGWDKVKDEMLLKSMAGIYDILPVNAGTEQQRAMDSLFSQSFNLIEAEGLTVSDKRHRLESAYEKLKNGAVIYDEQGNHFRLTGFQNRELTKNQQDAIKYFESYINALKQIEAFSPDIPASRVDVDRFIDDEGNVKTDAIKDDPYITDAGRQYIQRRSMELRAGLGQYGIHINAYNEQNIQVGKRSLLAEADPYYTGTYGYAAKDAEELLLARSINPAFDAYGKQLTVLLAKGYPFPSGTGDKNMLTAICNLYYAGGDLCREEIDKAIYGQDKLDSVNMGYALVRLYDLNAQAENIPAGLEESVQCIADILKYKEESAFEALEKAYFAKDARTVARELVYWQKNDLKSLEERGYVLHYSDSVGLALTNLKRELAATTQGDPDYKFYSDVIKEIDAIGKDAQAKNDFYESNAAEALFQAIEQEQNILAMGDSAPEKEAEYEYAPRRVVKWISQDEARQKYRNFLNVIAGNAEVSQLNPENSADLKTAAMAVACSMLQTEGAKKTFFGYTVDGERRDAEGRIRKNKQGLLSEEDMDAAFNRLVVSILQEPNVLKNAVYRSATPKEYSSSYRSLLRERIDIQITSAWRAEEREEKSKNKGKKINIRDKEDSIRLEKKEIEYLKKTRKELKELYVLDGTFRSSYMEKLYNKLGGVIDDAESNKGHVSKKDMQSLHNKAVVYYDKRKGILMGPVTDKGKARLE